MKRRFQKRPQIDLPPTLRGPCLHLVPSVAAGWTEPELCQECTLKRDQHDWRDEWIFTRQEIDEAHLYWSSYGYNVPPKPKGDWTPEHLAHLLTLRAGLHKTLLVTPAKEFDERDPEQVIALLHEHEEWGLMFRLYEETRLMRGSGPCGEREAGWPFWWGFVQLKWLHIFKFFEKDPPANKIFI